MSGGNAVAPWRLCRGEVLPERGLTWGKSNLWAWAALYNSGVANQGLQAGGPGSTPDMAHLAYRTAMLGIAITGAGSNPRISIRVYGFGEVMLKAGFSGLLPCALSEP